MRKEVAWCNPDPFYLSADCGQLLKPVLVLNPKPRGSLDEIMKDQWTNEAEKGEEWPLTEQQVNIPGPKRINMMTIMRFWEKELHGPLSERKCSEISATCFFLERKSSEPDSPHSSANRHFSLGKVQPGVDDHFNNSWLQNNYLHFS